MKQIKISEATPLQIDYLVAKCEGIVTHIYGGNLCYFLYITDLRTDRIRFNPSTDPAQGHPILEQEKISPGYWGDPNGAGKWVAMHHKVSHSERIKGIGPTMLIAGLRCFLVSRLGETAEVPDEI